VTMFTKNDALYKLLVFDRDAILRGEVWRLVSYVFLADAGNILFTAVFLICYFSIGRGMENLWGTCRFNLFYLCGIVLMDIYAMIFGVQADIHYLNTTLFLAYATLYPDVQFLVMYIIPIKARLLAFLELFFVVQDLIFYPFPRNLFPVVTLLNYFLFFGKDVLNVIPPSWRVNARRLLRKKGARQTTNTAAQRTPIQFRQAGSYEASTAQVKAPYTHRCTVCGRTDITNPDLEFRYCSRCQGYHCYCEEHISNHTHIQ